MSLGLRKPAAQPVPEPIKPANTFTDTVAPPNGDSSPKESSVLPGEDETLPSDTVISKEPIKHATPETYGSFHLAATADNIPTPTGPFAWLIRFWQRITRVATGSNSLLRIILGLTVGFLFFYNLADYCGFTGHQLRPHEMIYSNTMVQLWTATYRIIYITAFCFALISLVFVGLWHFFKPSSDQNFDLTLAIRNHLTPEKQIWLFIVVFFGFAFLFVMLLTVKLPESPSGLR